LRAGFSPKSADAPKYRTSDGNALTPEARNDDRFHHFRRLVSRAGSAAAAHRTKTKGPDYLTEINRILCEKVLSEA
jgi:hypothetical protein